MDVPFVDLRRQLTPILPEIEAAMRGVIDRCAFVGGPEVRAFEQSLAAWMGVAEACAVSSGTHALYLTLKALGIGAGDEVITAPNTAFPTSEAINLAGANVVFADIARGFFYVDPAAVERAITANTKAVIPVHLYGIPADLDPLLELARRRNLFIIEDAAQAMGARYKGKQVGTLGTAGCLSFFPSKNLGAFGDGGAVVSADPEVVKKVRMLANHGRLEKFSHLVVGTNSRLDTMKAAQLSICLRAVQEWNEDRRAAASVYDELLKPYEEIARPRVPAGSEAVWHLYVIRCSKRDDLSAFLKKEGIHTGLHYPRPLHLQPAYSYLGLPPGSFPEAERACQEVLSLPMFPKITAAEIETVVKAIARFLGKRREGVFKCPMNPLISRS